MNKLYIVMPVYNEEGAIEKIVDQWHAVAVSAGSGSKLVVFDDGSRDRTPEILKKIKGQYQDLIIISRQNSGHGPTCIAAYRFAVAEGADWIFQTDADGQTNPDDFRSFWAKKNIYDFIIGWRLRRSDGPLRRFVSWVLKWSVFLIFGRLLKDANTPFRLMNAGRLRKYLALIPDNYFLPNTLLSVMVAKNGEKVLWQEISFAPRQSGVSSMPFVKVAGRGIGLIRQLYKMRKIKLPE